MLYNYIIALATSFLFGYRVFIPFVMQCALRFSLLDRPNGSIKMHEKPIPYLGGLAVFASLISSLLFIQYVDSMITWLIIGVSLLLCLGLVDDLKAMTPAQKLCGQIIAVMCFLRGGFSLKATFLSSYLNLFYTGFWMISVINAFNLIDVMDGLATVVALIAAIAFCIITVHLGQISLSILLLGFIGALGAFLVYNKPPARIYLGDAGAHLIGGFLAAVPMLIPWHHIGWNAYYAPVIILAIPLLEIFFLVVIRSNKGIPFYKASPDHFSIYLRNKGWSRSRILAFVASAGLILNFVTGIFLAGFIGEISLFFCGILFFTGWIYVVFF